MCKVLMLTKTDKMDMFSKAIRVISQELLGTEKDGFGYSVLGQKGIFGERTLREGPFFTRIRKREHIIDFPFVEKTCNDFGKFSKPLGAGIFHGRTSTNDVNLLNTHPINKSGWTLIHNGVVTNRGPNYKQKTTNDTEHLLHYLSTVGISGIEEHITGYYAIGAIDPKGNLHVIKDSIAHLYVAKNLTLDCYMFGTSEYSMRTVCKAMDWDIGPVDKVADDTYLIFDKHGELTECRSFKSRGYQWEESQYSGKSLGYELENERYNSIAEAFENANLESFANKKPVSYGDVIDMTKPDMEELRRESELNFLQECTYLDASYTIEDYNGRPVTVEEFRKMDDYTKLSCVVIRGDGTIVDPENYFTDRIA